MAKSRALAQIMINTPCTESWDGMNGDEKKRFCGKCKKNVFNLSEMSKDEAEALVFSGNKVCVRLFRRPDGTVLTKECGTGMRRRWRMQAVFGGLMMLILSGLGLRHSVKADDYVPSLGGVKPETPFVMGDIALPEREPPPTPEPEITQPRIITGKIESQK